MILSDIWAAGIDFALPGNGGPDCLNHTSAGFRATETLVTLGVFVLALATGIKYHTPPAREGLQWPRSKDLSRKALLTALLLTYLAEIGYKAVTYQFIFVVNPCHLLCLIHLYLLSDLHSGYAFKSYLFVVHLFYLHGPLMACIFPVTNTLFLPGEVLTYWLEHALLLTVPVYLLRHYTVPTKSFRELVSWSLLAYGVWGLYHYLFLQPLALLTYGNLNSILCPAITDPFRGPYYRLHALWHQSIATIISGSFWWSFCIQENKKSTKPQ